MTWRKDKAWSDRFLPQIKRILGEHLIGEPPVEEDAERNTDLIVLRMDAVRIGCRVRTNQYLTRYGDEFTIRAGRPSGAKTELTKIIEGWGDYFLYGFSDATDADLCQWMLGDMRVFRLWFNRYLVANNGNIPGVVQNNHDGSSYFIAFSIAALPAEFVVARQVYEPHAISV